jgi:hypothetical protein
MSWPEPGPENRYLFDHATRLVVSYRRVTGRELLPGDDARDLGRRLFEAPFVVVSHDLRPDPIFNYGNLAALRLFEMTWQEFTSLPSRLSAEPMHRDERARLLDTVARQGFIDDYRGIRISKSGARFTIEQATVWNVIDDSGPLLGQAATFSTWTPI